jgi:outer membrane protein assembly factor BamA
MVRTNNYSRRFSLVRRFFALVPCMALCVGAAISVAAQEPQSVSGRLESIKVTGSAKFTSDQIAPATGLQVGQQVTREELQGGANTLADLGPFTNVRYRFFSGVSGVQVQYEVADAPTVPVFFDDFPWFTDAQMIAYIKTSVPLFDGTAPEHGKILDDIANTLSNELQARTITANVSHELLTLPWNEQQVMEYRAHVEPMPLIQSVAFSDPLASADRGVLDRMGDLVGKPFSRSLIRTFEFEQVRPVYLAHALLAVQFGEPVVHLSGSNVIVEAPIVPGPAFTWNGATWEGNHAISSADLDKLVNLVSGASANGMQIQATWEGVRSAFEKLGYLDVAIDPVPRFDEASKRASYDVKISEGPQYHMGKLVLSGLSMEGERRLRSAWKIAPGAVFDDSVYQAFLDSGIREAFSGLPIHYQTIQKYLDKHPAQAEINVMLNFE